MWSNRITINLHFCCKKCWINIFSGDWRAIKMTPLRTRILLKNIDERNFQDSDDIVSSNNIFVSHFKCNVFRFIWNLGSNFNALIPFWIETRNIWCLDLVTTELCYYISFNLAANKINWNKTFSSINLNCYGAID